MDEIKLNNFFKPILSDIIKIATFNNKNGIIYHGP